MSPQLAVALIDTAILVILSGAVLFGVVVFRNPQAFAPWR